MLLILPGYSLHNKDWAVEVKKYLKTKIKEEILIHEWRHYKDPDISFSVRYEIETIKKEIGDKSINLIAKSVGVAVAMELIPQIRSQINKVILCGIASVSDDRKQAFNKVLTELPLDRLLCIQNRKDKFVVFTDAKRFYHSVSPKVKVISKPRSDHEYPYFEDFEKFVIHR